jgi:hypothetical protein
MTREEAYDMIDRYLRAVMHDRDYADYSAALDVILTPPPAPRVVVLDHWQLLSKGGAVSEVGITSAADAEEARVYHDATWPADAPHRVVRLAMVEDDTPEAPADGA